MQNNINYISKQKICKVKHDDVALKSASVSISLSTVYQPKDGDCISSSSHSRQHLNTNARQHKVYLRSPRQNFLSRGAGHGTSCHRRGCVSCGCAQDQAVETKDCCNSPSTTINGKTLLKLRCVTRLHD